MGRASWDEAKRQWTLLHRRIDFIDFMDVFDDPAGVVRPDTRQDYGEARWNIRKANRREQRSYERERADRHSH